MTKVSKLIQPTALQKEQIYEQLLPEMMAAAKTYLSIAEGNRNVQGKGQLSALQDVWRTLTSVADQHTLEILIERLESAEKGEVANIIEHTVDRA